MSNELSTVANWTFFQDCEVPSEVYALFVPGETAQAAYKTIRDVAVFTNKRLIVCDSQGLTGKKKEIYSLPWKSVNMWSTENAGKFLDLDAEVELWTRAGHFKISLRKGADLNAIESLIANNVL